MNEAGSVKIGAARGSGHAGIKLGYAGCFSGGQNLVEHGRLILRDVGSGRDYAGIARGPSDGSDSGGDVDSVAVGERFEAPGLPLRKTVVGRRDALGGIVNLHAIHMLVDVDGGGCAADSVDDCGHQRDAGIAGAAKGDAGIPCTGAGISVSRHGKRGGSACARRDAYDKLNADTWHRAASGIFAGSAKGLGRADVHREGAGGAQRNRYHSALARGAAVFSQASGEGEHKDDG